MDRFFLPFPSNWLSTEIVKPLGSSVWLLLLLLDLVVRSIDNIGIVSGGKSLHDEDLYLRLGISPNTLTRHRTRLEDHGFIITRTTRYGLKQWFVIGSHKYQGKKDPERQVDLVQSILAEISAKRPPDRKLICNPFYFEVVDRFDAKVNQSRVSTTNSGSTTANNGGSIGDKRANKSNDKARNIDREASGLHTTANMGRDLRDEEEKNLHPEVHSIYMTYVALMGSNSQYPNSEERLLIEEALAHEDFEKLKTAIGNYDGELFARDGSWRVLATSEFFTRERYSRFLEEPGPRSRAPQEDDIPF